MPALNPLSPRYLHPEYDRPTEFGINGICVLESVRPGDKKTGSELAQWLKLRCLQLNIDVKYTAIASKKSLVKHLNAIRNEVEVGLVPLIQFELHGNSDGVQVGADMVPWESLLNLLRTINAACGHNLLVSFAACRSFYIYPRIDIFKPAPFFLVIGCVNPVSTANVEVGFHAFFEELFTSHDIGTALTALNQAIDDPKEFFSGELAQSLFEGVWLMMQDEWAEPESRQKQIHSFMAQALKSIHIRQNSTLPELRRFIENERSESEMAKRKKQALDYFLFRTPRPEWYGVTARGQQLLL
jgi:hypothetical protein